MRERAAHASQMVSMMLFGELFRVLKQENDWHFIETIDDEYQGWINKRVLYAVDEEFLNAYLREQAVFTAENYTQYTFENKKLPITLGSRLPAYDQGSFSIGKAVAHYTESLIIAQNPHSEAVLEVAYKYLDTPYLWGGKSIFGIDCSGFSQMIFKLCGILLPRDAWQQAQKGSLITNLEDAVAGDLVFFAENVKISHVGILDGKGNIIHASGKVRIDKIDCDGIFNAEIQKHTLKPVLIKRVLPS